MLLKYLPIYFLPLGCFGLSSGFQAIAGVFFLIGILKYNFIYHYKMFFKENLIKINFAFMLLWILTVMAADVYSENSIYGIKEGWHYFQRMLPFGLCGLFFVNDKKYFKFAWLGLVSCMFIININVIYNFIVQGHWRPYTMMGRTNQVSGFLVLVLPFIISGIYAFKDNKYYKIIGIFLVVFTLISLIVSGSRGAIIGIILAYFFTGMYFLHKRYTWQEIVKKVSLIIIILFFIFSSIYLIYPNFIFRSYDMERVYLWKSSINMFVDNPLFGIGQDNFNKVYLHGYISEYAKEPYLNSPHNIFLYFFVERGIFAGISFLLMFIFQVLTFLKNIFNVENKINIWAMAGCVSVLGMGIHGLVDTQIQMRAYFLMYWFLFGIGCCSIVADRKSW